MRGHQATPETTNAQISQLLRRLIAAQETERSRIARDLHDDVSQRIAVLSITIGSVKRTLSGKPDQVDVMTALTSIQQGVLALADEIRQLSHDLHPALLQHADLDTALRAFCAQFQSRQAIDVTYRADVDIARLGADMALCLYRIVQEALRNVAKHAEAHHVGVTLTQMEDEVQLSIVDDGRGFDLAGVRGGRGLGLVSIDERARLLGGRVRFETQPQLGTCVHVEIPWPAEGRVGASGGVRWQTMPSVPPRCSGSSSASERWPSPRVFSALSSRSSALPPRTAQQQECGAGSDTRSTPQSRSWRSSGRLS